MGTFREDYKSGTAKEDELLDILKAFFKDDIVKDKNKYAILDYKGEHYYEMKSRNVKATAYPDTIITKKKIDYYNKLNTDKHLYLIFPFTDCIKYIQYNKEVFDNFKCEEFVRHQRGDFNDKKQLYYFIPINALLEV
jgi:hypothetical protein